MRQSVAATDTTLIKSDASRKGGGLHTQRDLLHVNKSVSCAMKRCWLTVADLLGLWLSLTL